MRGLNTELQDFARTDSLLILDGARELPRRSKAILALGIMFGTVGLASIGLLPIAISALAGAILMFVTGCVKFDRVGRALSAKVIVLVAASIAVGRIVLESGAAEWLGMALAAVLQFLPPAAILAAIMLFVTVLTNFASNATAATVGTPIAFSIADKLGLPSSELLILALFAQFVLRHADCLSDQHADHGRGQLSVSRLYPHRCAPGLVDGHHSVDPAGDHYGMG
ncbi:MAG: SLC13 family permease [Sphingomonadaceae bacterium]